MQRKQTVLDITAGDLSGLEQIEDRLDKLAQKAGKLQSLIRDVGGAAEISAAGPEARLGGGGGGGGGRRSGRGGGGPGGGGGGGGGGTGGGSGGGTGGGGGSGGGTGVNRQILGVGQLGAGAISAAASGSPAGVLGGLSALITNPWAMAGMAIAGAGAMVGKQGFDEAYGTVTDYYAAEANLAPYAGRSPRNAWDIVAGRGRARGVELGYGPTESLGRYAAYARAAGLEDAGLSMSNVLDMERGRGIRAEVAGAASSMFAAGRGGAGGTDPDKVAQFFRSAIGEGLAQGLKNAHLPEYLSKVAEVTTRYARAGFDVNPLDILGVQAGMRATGGRFEGTRAMDAISVFQGASQGINSMFNFIPREAMTQTIAARYMRRFKGDPVAAKIAFQRDLASGGIVKEAVSAARMQGGRGMAALALSEFLGDQLGMAEDILPLVGRYKGRGKISEADLYDETLLGREAIPHLGAKAGIQQRRAETGKEYIKSMERVERDKELFKQYMGRKTGGAVDKMFNIIDAPSETIKRLEGVPTDQGIPQEYQNLERRRTPYDQKNPTTGAYTPRSNDPATALLQAAQLLADAAADFRRGRSDLPPVVVG